VKSPKDKRYVFGPVPSRRLGRSLGVDPVPYKTCNYDCLYCQLGPTPQTTMERKEYVPAEAILAEAALRFEAGVQADVITLSGSGEPTLHSDLGRIIRGLKALNAAPVVVLTNGSLLWQEEVREALAAADTVVPSLDAGDAAMFGRINRPHADISFERMVEGLAAFRGGYSGHLWLEVFLLAGLTDTEAEAAKMAALARYIRPDRVQLNTVARPPAYAEALAVPRARMIELARLFGDGAEVIADFRGDHRVAAIRPGFEAILEMLERRPCTADDIAASLRLLPGEVEHHLARLLTEGSITTAESAGKLYYLPSRE
jgi:wyosine [tRNA(Phe)-imidazoG37] synthetase (radical SAM superfamily)